MTSEITRTDLIELVGDAIVKVDVLRSKLDPGEPDRVLLDDARDELSYNLNKLVKSAIADNTAEFKKQTTLLAKVNTKLRNTIQEVGKVAETLQTLVKFIDVLEDIVKLIPLSASLKSRVMQAQAAP